MRLTKYKSSVWDTFTSWKGRYKNFKVKITEGSNKPFGRTVDYYWFSVQSDKYNKVFNSLWENLKFTSLEEAKQGAIKWIDLYIKAQPR